MSLSSALLALGPGAMVALLTLGLVVVHRATGTINFAHGAMATFGAYAYLELTADHGWSTWPAVAGSVVLTGLLGVLTQVLIMRKLASAPPLNRLIASLGILIVIQYALLLRYGSDIRRVPRLLPSDPVEILGVAVGSDRLILLAIAAALTAALWAVFRFTTFGLVTSAASENRVAAMSLGRSPGALAIGNWFIGAALAGFAGVMLSPYMGIYITGMTLLIVPALAAALIGNFRSFPLVLLGALVVAVLQAQAQELTSLRGASSLVPFVLIVVIMLARGTSLPSRGFLTAKLPAVSAVHVNVPAALAAAAVLLVSIWTWLPGNWVQAVLSSLLVAIILLSIVVVTGFAGQISLAQFGLAGIGAYVAGNLVANNGWPFEFAFLIAVLTAVATGLLLSIPAVKMRGASLAIVTLSFSAVLSEVIFSRTEVLVVPSPRFLGIDLLPIAAPHRYLTFVLLVFIVIAVLIVLLRHSPVGRRMLAVRGNERAAASIGIDARKTKAFAFGAAAGIAAVGGVLLSFRSTAQEFAGFGPLESVHALAFSVIGGVGYVTGALHGSTLTPSGVGSAMGDMIFGDGIDRYLGLLGGIFVLLIVVFKADGLASDFDPRRHGTKAARSSRLPAFISRFKNRSYLAEWQVAGGSVEAAPKAHSGLEVNKLTVTFGTTRAVDDVSLNIAPGIIRGLIGPNGAGKTAFIDAVAGFVATSSGSVLVNDERLDGLSPWRRARVGIARSFQSLELFSDLTVGENIKVADEIGESIPWTGRFGLARTPSLTERAWRAVRALGLEDDLNTPTKDLSAGRQQLVSIARALACRPTVLLLDEPAAGMDSKELREFGKLLRKIAIDYQVAILLIEHDVDFVMQVCDSVTVLEFGSVLFEGTGEEVAASPAVRAAYLGEDDEAGPNVLMPEEVEVGGR